MIHLHLPHNPKLEQLAELLDTTPEQIVQTFLADLTEPTGFNTSPQHHLASWYFLSAYAEPKNLPDLAEVIEPQCLEV